MEPERKIEKLLRAFANKRRADASDLPGLHPAARRMLQAEVAKRFAEPEEDSVSLWQLFRQRWAVLLGFALIIFFCASMFLPALTKAKSKSQNVTAMNNLRQIGVAAQMAANENNGQLPVTLDALTNGYVSDKLLTDPVSGKRFVYVAGGEKLGELQGNSVLAYSPGDQKSRTVLLADGSVQMMSATQFVERSRSGLLQRNPSLELAINSVTPLAAPPASLPAPAAVPLSAANHRPVATAAPNVPETVNLAGKDANVSAGAPAGAGKPDRGFKDGDVAKASRDELAMAERKASFKKSVDAAQALQSTANNSSQKFVQTVSLSAAAKAPPVLASFEVQQNGKAIAVVDRDGSVYNGFVAEESFVPQNTGAAASTQVNLRNRAEAKSEPVQVQANFNFRVEGQNRTSKQNIVFTGNLIPLPGTNAVTQSTLILNARITGTVTVDETNRIQIDAVPMSP